MNGYLCLSRKRYESVWIITPHGERIEVKIIESEKSKVRLAIAADKRVKILRSELLATQGSPAKVLGDTCAG